MSGGFTFLLDTVYTNVIPENWEFSTTIKGHSFPIKNIFDTL